MKAIVINKSDQSLSYTLIHDVQTVLKDYEYYISGMKKVNRSVFNCYFFGNML